MAEAWFRRFTANSYRRTVQSQPVRPQAMQLPAGPLSAVTSSLTLLPTTAHCSPGPGDGKCTSHCSPETASPGERLCSPVRTQGRVAGCCASSTLHPDDCSHYQPSCTWQCQGLSTVRAGPLNTPFSALVPAENTLPCSSWTFFGHLGGAVLPVQSFQNLRLRGSCLSPLTLCPDCSTTVRGIQLCPRAHSSWSWLAGPQTPTCLAPYHGRTVVVVLVAWLPGLEAAPAETMVTSGTSHAVEDSSWSVGTSGYRCPGCPGAVHTDKVPSSQALLRTP